MDIFETQCMSKKLEAVLVMVTAQLADWSTRGSCW